MNKLLAVAMIVLFVLLLSVVATIAQEPDLQASSLPGSSPAQITFERFYGNGGDELGVSIQQTSDGGYIIAGATTSFGAGEFDVYLIKTDAVGNILWTQTYGGPGIDVGWSVQQTSDGGNILVGCTACRTDSSDVYLIKTDAVGNTLWTRTYGGPAEDGGVFVQQTSDAGYIISGFTNSFGAGGFDVYTIKTDATGAVLWQMTEGGVADDEGNAVQETSDGGYIIAGDTQSFGAGGRDVYLIKTDAVGNTLWTRTFGGAGNELPWTTVQQTLDGGYITAGWTISFGADERDVYFIKTDSSGATLWTKTYGGPGDDYAHSTQQTSDGGYIISGGTFSFADAGGYDLWLIKTDTSGDAVWRRTYGGPADDDGWSVQQTIDGGYVVAGGTRSFGAGDRDMYLIKTDENGLVRQEISIDIKPQRCANPLNTRARGYLQVAILGGPDLDVSEVDASSVRLVGVAPKHSRFGDVSRSVVDEEDESNCSHMGRDGFQDLVLGFDSQEVVAALGEVNHSETLILTLTGELRDGTPIEGRDFVVIAKRTLGLLRRGCPG